MSAHSELSHAAPLDCRGTTRGKISLAPRPDPKLTTEALWAAVDQARAECLRPAIPAGWFTLKQYRDQYGVSERTARTELSVGFAKGKLKTDTAVVKGHTCRIWGLA